MMKPNGFQQSSSKRNRFGASRSVGGHCRIRLRSEAEGSAQIGDFHRDLPTFFPLGRAVALAEKKGETRLWGGTIQKKRLALR